MDEHNCRRAICSVLAGREVFELKHRLARIGVGALVGEYIGVVDLRSSPDCIECAFRYGWGDASYCDNQEILLRLRLEELKALGKKNG
jgi:hypothetical protein